MDGAVRSMTNRRRAAEHASRMIAETSNLFPSNTAPSDIDGLWKGKKCWLAFELKCNQAPLQGGQWWMLRDMVKALGAQKPTFLVGIWYTPPEATESILTRVEHFVVFWSTKQSKCVRRTDRRAGGHLSGVVGMLVDREPEESIETLEGWELAEWSDRWRLGAV